MGVGDEVPRGDGAFGFVDGFAFLVGDGFVVLGRGFEGTV